MEKINIQDISAGRIYDLKLDTTALSAENVLTQFNAVIDELNTKDATDELYAVDEKYPIEYENKTNIGEFHAICSNDDGSIVVFGSDENGDDACSLLYSHDKMATINRAVVEPIINVIPNFSSYFKSNYEQFRTIVYDSKLKIFITTKLNIKYFDRDGNIFEATCIWTSHTGKNWKCVCLDTINTYFNVTMFENIVTKLAYDVENDLVIVPSTNKIFYSKDCVEWKKINIPNASETVYSDVYHIGCIDIIGNGKYLAWNVSKYIKNQGVFELTYDSVTDSFNCGSIIRLSDELYKDLSDRYTNKGYNIDSIGNNVDVTNILNGKAYCGFYSNNNPGLIGFLVYDIEEKKFVSALNELFTNRNDTIRGTFTYGENIYFLLRSGATGVKPSIIKIDANGNIINVGITNDFKLENGGIVNGKCYIVGRNGGHGLLYEFDDINNSLTNVEYYGRIVLTLLHSAPSLDGKTFDISSGLGTMEALSAIIVAMGGSVSTTVN